MLKRNPETYNEVVHLRKMLELAKYYQVSSEVLDEISDFVLESPKNIVICDTNSIVLKSGENIYKTFQANKISNIIDGLKLSAVSLIVIPHYTPSSGGGYSGGSSSNNNNNNNNNNN